MSENLINKTAVRGFLLRKMKEKRPQTKFNRVSKELLDDLEAEFRQKLLRLVSTVPAAGKTIKR